MFSNAVCRSIRLTILFVRRNNAWLAGCKGLIEGGTATRGAVQQVVEEVGFVDIYNLSNCRSAQWTVYFPSRFSTTEFGSSFSSLSSRPSLLVVVLAGRRRLSGRLVVSPPSFPPVSVSVGSLYVPLSGTVRLYHRQRRAFRNHDRGRTFPSFVAVCFAPPYILVRGRRTWVGIRVQTSCRTTSVVYMRSTFPPSRRICLPLSYLPRFSLLRLLSSPRKSWLVTSRSPLNLDQFSRRGAAPRRVSLASLYSILPRPFPSTASIAKYNSTRERNVDWLTRSHSTTRYIRPNKYICREE